jgi:hypothetical protein
MRLTSALDANNDPQCAETSCSTLLLDFNQSMDYEETVRHCCGAEIEHLKPGFSNVKYLWRGRTGEAA